MIPVHGAPAVPALRRLYWETTAGCNLRCIHCRRIDASDRVSPDELNTDQAFGMIDDLASMGKPVLILSGGEPLFRRDIFDIAAYASGRGLPVALSTNGTLVNAALARKARESGVYYASVSLDGARAATHDRFRGQGRFEMALNGIARLKEAGLKVQINFTLTNKNRHELAELHALASSLGAHALYLFLLVPVGCGVQIADSDMLSAPEVEECLKWILSVEKSGPMEVRAICAPQFYRVKLQALKEKGEAAPPARRMGCLAGIDIGFVSHRGDVFPCGYLPVSAGNIKETRFSEIWKTAPLFAGLRDIDRLEGKCGICQYKMECGGCRARAYFQTGSELTEEPYCEYEPAGAL